LKKLIKYFQDYEGMLKSKKPAQGSETALKLAGRLKLKVSNISLLTRALTHRSFINEHPEEIEDNERLEFLGDAVLDFVVGEWLYNRFPEMPEGGLTQMRSALVQTPQLAEFARKIKIGNALRLGKGESKAGGRLRNSVLCDAFEALIGAIYLDSGISGVKSFINSQLESAAQEILVNHKNEDPKSILQEWAQSFGYPPPKYQLINSVGPDHSKIFHIQVVVNKEDLGSGKGTSKQEAEKKAARTALIKIGIIEK
jgi:ribonuclease-3